MTLGIAVVTVLALMFGSGDEPGRRTGWFDSVYFETRPSGNGVTMAVGVQNFVPLVVTMLVVAVIVGVFLIIFTRLRQRQAFLRARAAQH